MLASARESPSAAAKVRPEPLTQAAFCYRTERSWVPALEFVLFLFGNFLKVILLAILGLIGRCQLSVLEVPETSGWLVGASRNHPGA